MWLLGMDGGGHTSEVENDVKLALLTIFRDNKELPARSYRQAQCEENYICI